MNYLKLYPLLAKVYPNMPKDVNQFHEAGGMTYIMEQLLAGGYLHDDAKTVVGNGLTQYTKTPRLNNEQLEWTDAFNLDNTILRSKDEPFSHEGGCILLSGNRGWCE